MQQNKREHLVVDMPKKLKDALKAKARKEFKTMSIKIRELVREYVR